MTNAVRFRLWIGTFLVLILSFSNFAHADPSPGRGVLAGHVLNVSTGEYLERARVSLAGTSMVAFTDATGAYRISDIPAGRYQVLVFFTGLAPLTRSIDVEPAVVAQQEFQLGVAPSDGKADGGVIKLDKFVVEEKEQMDGPAIAINQQRFAPNITNVVDSKEFGISADGSVGEFMKYLPGVAVNYSGGAADTLSINGTPTNNVPITFNGFNLASTSSASTSRSVELLQMSIQNLSRLELLMSPTPESAGSDLGGSINLVPRSAFEFSQPVATASLYMIMRDNYKEWGPTPGPMFEATNKIKPGGDFLVILPLSKRIGITLSGGYSDQFVPQDTSESAWRGAGYATTGLTASGSQYPTTTSQAPYLSDYTMLDERKTNVRSNFGATVDFKATPHDTISFAYTYGSFSSEYTFNSIAFSATRIDPGNFGPTFTNGDVGAGSITNSAGARWRGGATNMPTITWRHRGDVWNADFGFGYSDSTNRLEDSKRGYFGSATAVLKNVTIDYSNIFYLRPGTITVTDATGSPIDPYNLSNYTLTATGSPNPRFSNDIERQTYANLSRDWNLGPVTATVKVGADTRDALRDIRGSSAAYTFADPNANAGQFVDNAFAAHGEPYGFPGIQWINTQQLWELYQSNPSYFVGNAATNYVNAVNLSKRVEELVASEFVRVDLSMFSGRLRITGGVRDEDTDMHAQGPLMDPTANYQKDSNGNIVLSSGSPVLLVPTSNALGVDQLVYTDRGLRVHRDYNNLFPSFNLGYNLRENLILRGAYFWSIGRPDYNQYAGGVTLPNTESPPSATNVITANNVNIHPWTAKSAQTRLEYYFEGVGEFAIGGFVRRFDNFFGSSLAPVTPAFLSSYGLDPNVYGSYEVSSQYNLPQPVWLSGWNIEYKQSLNFLPSWASGLQVFANASFLHSDGPAAAAASLDGYVSRIYNWGFSYTKKRYDFRAGWNYTGRHQTAAVASAAGIEPGTFTWASKRLQIDVQGEYFVFKRIAVFANLRNVNDGPFDQQIFGPDTPDYARFRERDDYGSSWTFGVKGTF